MDKIKRPAQEKVAFAPLDEGERMKYLCGISLEPVPASAPNVAPQPFPTLIAFKRNALSKEVR